MSSQVFRVMRLEQGRHGGQATLCANAAGIGEILFAQVLLGVLIPAPGTSTSPFVFFDGGKTRPMNSENGPKRRCRKFSTAKPCIWRGFSHATAGFPRFGVEGQSDR